MPKRKAKKEKGKKEVDKRKEKSEKSLKANLRNVLNEMNEHLDAAEAAKKKGKAAKDKKAKKRWLKEVGKHLRRARGAKKRFIKMLPGYILGWPFWLWYGQLEDVDFYIDSILDKIGNDLTPVGRGENFGYINFMIDSAKVQKSELEKMLGE